MKNFIRLLSLILSLLICFKANAQVKNAKDGLTKVAKFKPPKVKSFLGRNSDTASVTVDEATQLTGLPINVKDDQNNSYVVTSYGFIYKSNSLVENEENGKKEVKYTTVGDRFKTSPLPEVWKVNIQRTIKKGHQLYFYDILVKDKQGRIFYAPNILIKVQ